MSPPTPRELILAATRGEALDVVPAALWQHFPGRDTSSDALAESVVAHQRTCRFDLVKITFASGYPAEAWGARMGPGNGIEGTRQYIQHAIGVPEDWRSLAELEPEGSGLARELATVRRVRVAVGPDIHVLATVFSPLTVAKQLIGRETLLEHLAHHAADLHAGLRVVADSMARFAAATLRHGADGVFFATQFARRDTLSQEQHEEFGQAYDRVVLDALAGTEALLLLHLCGRDVMLELADGYGAHIVNWDDQAAGPALSDGLAARRAGAVMGGLDRQRLLRVSPAEVAADVRAIVSASGGRRLVIGAGCVTFQGTPLENQVTVRAAAHDPHAT